MNGFDLSEHGTMMAQFHRRKRRKWVLAFLWVHSIANERESTPISECFLRVHWRSFAVISPSTTPCRTGRKKSWCEKGGTPIFASSLAQHCPKIGTLKKGKLLQAIEYQHAVKLNQPLFTAGTTDAETNAENRFMRYMFYIRYYVVPPASFGVFVAAEALFLYGLYRAFVAP
jgi:hypothetical protein